MTHSTSSSYKVEVPVRRSPSSCWTKDWDTTEPDFHQVLLQLVYFEIYSKKDVRSSHFVTFFPMQQFKIMYQVGFY